MDPTACTLDGVQERVQDGFIAMPCLPHNLPEVADEAETPLHSSILEQQNGVKQEPKDPKVSQTDDWATNALQCFHHTTKSCQ